MILFCRVEENLTREDLKIKINVQLIVKVFIRVQLFSYKN